MTTPTTLDGLLVQWGDRLFYPGNRVVRAPPAALSGAGLHNRARAIRARLHATALRGAPQVMVKVTGGGRGMAAIAAHFRYISRQGRLPIEDDRGVVHQDKEGVHDLVEQWRHAGARIAEHSERREALNIMPITDLADDPKDPQHSPEERAAAASRSTWVSVGVNLILTLTQVTVGILAKSQGLVADGNFVVLFASHHAKKDADEDHPYGHQRFETAASLVLGALLLAVGIGMLWSAFRKLEEPDLVQRVHIVALWVAGGALVAKELLFRYMLSVAKRVKSSMLVANAWHARSDAASSLVVGIGIIGNLAGYPILDPIAALIVGFMVAKMGWSFGWDAMHDLMDRSVDEQEVAAIRQTLVDTPGVKSVHDIRTRKMGDMIVVDAHIEVDAAISVEAGHDIAVEARQRVLQRHRVLNLMSHVDPWRRPDLDDAGPTVPAS